MRRSLGPLLCELHAHTRWSDDSSRGSPRPGCPQWPAATSTSRSTSAAGRRSSPRATKRTPSIEYLRSPRPVFLTRFDDELARVAA